MCSSHLHPCAVAVLSYGAGGGGGDSYPETGLPWKILFPKWHIHSSSNMEPVLGGEGAPHLFPELLGCHVTSSHGDAGVFLVNGSWISQILPGSTRKEKVAGILWPSFKINSAFRILLVKAINVQPGSRGERVSLFLMEQQCSMKNTWGWDVFHHSGLESQA